MIVNVAAFSAGYCVRPFEGPKRIRSDALWQTLASGIS